MTDLETRVERLEREVGIGRKKWDNPTNWNYPHTKIGSIGSFIAHADQKGRLLIQDPDSGRVQCIGPPRMQRLLDVVEEVANDD